MTKSVRLRPLTGRERRILRAKLGDLSLAVRIHQRYRIIDEVRKGRSVLDVADRVGCYLTIATCS